MNTGNVEEKVLKIDFQKVGNRNFRILCLGAHSDDIEIGCGGSILRLLKEHKNIEVYWVVFGSSGKRDKEALESANKFLADAKKKKVIIKNFKDSFFPYSGGEIKTFFERVIKGMSPDLIFTHYRHDLHQDHRIVSDFTWNTFRGPLILEYEIIKYDGDIGIPNLFVHLSDAICREKINIIMDCYKTQGRKDWFTRDAFSSILRIRGIESKAPGNYAEGFYCRKVTL